MVNLLMPIGGLLTFFAVFVGVPVIIAIIVLAIMKKTINKTLKVLAISAGVAFVLGIILNVVAFSVKANTLYENTQIENDFLESNTQEDVIQSITGN